ISPGGRNAHSALGPRVLLCPADPVQSPQAEWYAPGENATYPDGVYHSISSYGGNAGTQGYATYPAPPLVKDGMFTHNSRLRIADVTDGTSSTILFGERIHLEPLLNKLFQGPNGRIDNWGRWHQTWALRSALAEINYRLPDWVATNPPQPGTSAF